MARRGMAKDDQDEAPEGEGVSQPGLREAPVEAERLRVRSNSRVSRNGESGARNFNEQTAQAALKQEKEDPV